MSKIIQTYTKKINYNGHERTEKLQLKNCGTYFAILTYREGISMPSVNTGTAKYINKVWKEKTGLVGDCR